jgi:hypothetical protein
MKEEGRRVADGLDIARGPPEQVGMSRHGRDPQHNQRDDAQHVGVAEAAMLKELVPDEALLPALMIGASRYSPRGDAVRAGTIVLGGIVADPSIRSCL